MLDESRLAFAEALRLSPTSDAGRAQLLWLYGSQCMNANRHTEARAVLREAIDTAKKVENERVVCLSRIALVSMAAWLSNPDSGVVEEAHDAVRAAEALGAPEACLWAHHTLADVLRLRRDHPAALSSARLACTVARSSEDLGRVYLATSLFQCGDINASAGDLEEARATYVEAGEISKSRGHPRGEATSRVKLAFIELATGSPATAATQLEEVRRDVPEAFEDPEFGAYVSAIVGYAAFLMGQRELATVEFGSALAAVLALPTAVPYELSPPLVGLAELAASAGEWSQTAAYLAAAVGKFLPSPLDFYAVVRQDSRKW